MCKKKNSLLLDQHNGDDAPKKKALHDIFLFKYHFLLHILRFLFFFSDNIMADVARKQQTKALFLSTIDT